MSLSDLTYIHPHIDPIRQCIMKDNSELMEKWPCCNFNCNLIKSKSCKTACRNFKAQVEHCTNSSVLCVLGNPANYNNESNDNIVNLDKRDVVEVIKEIISFGLSKHIKDNAQCNKDGAKYTGRWSECKFNCYSEPSDA
ncbi:hypothetical protein PIROE2DRAFT_6607 [Piromyces sp. E2]|nr:hypothetical protein PIROE2DRAFT_6607 [Piromyces sp. E2]|eukprot:OUM66260.1 hypothetical protein PIROE2DRAFT_6607 [Piromyces sp. E2]